MSGVPGVQFFVRDAALWAQVTPVAERLPPGRAALQDALDAAGLGVWSLDDDVLDRLVARCADSTTCVAQDPRADKRCCCHCPTWC